jgi:O-antigen ligase
MLGIQDADKPILFGFLERKISLVFLPAMVGYFMMRGGPRVWKQIQWFVYGTTFLGLIINAIIPFLYQNLTHFNHVAYRNAFEAVSGMHPTYYGLYAIFSICILQFEANSMPQWVKSSLQITLVLMVLLLAPKVALICLFLFFVYISIFTVTSWKSMVLRLFIGFSGIVLSYVSIPYFRQRVQEVILFSLGKQTTDTNSMDYRSLIWQIDWNLLRENWLFGLGPVNLERSMTRSFQYLSFLSGKELGHYNTHNEYLNQWLSFGILGIITFLWILGILCIAAYRSRNRLFISWIFMLILFFLTENILSRQHGILFFTVFTGWFYGKQYLSQKQIKDKVSMP